MSATGQWRRCLALLKQRTNDDRHRGAKHQGHQEQQDGYDSSQVVGGVAVQNQRMQSAVALARHSASIRCCEVFAHLRELE